MATLVLQAAGAFAGNLVGGPFGAMIGQAAGAVAGSVIDQRLFGASGRNSSGPRLTRMPGISAVEGAPVTRVFGRARIGGTLIWMTRFEEAVAVSRAGGSGGKSNAPKTTSYSYFGNFAVGVCEGPIAEVRRIYADGVELDQTRLNIRIHRGSETQTPDPLIVAKEGAENAPAFRGIAYVVFERLPLVDFGNRVPQFSFEVVKPVAGVNELVQGVCIIPGSSEFAYEPGAVIGSLGQGISQSENRHVLSASSDWNASVNSLQAICPNVKSAALVVAWFGDDLRVDQCRIAPRSEKPGKVLFGFNWSVAGLTRASAQPVSAYDDKPAYGGTPSDASVIAAIADMKARGLEVTFYPFVMMDIAQGNTLPDPWSSNSFQPAYPWRGRIVCNPAPGRPGSPDGSAGAAAQIATFFGSPSPPQNEWSYRRFILHYANLCVQAGGVDTFLIGSELVGLTHVRSAAGIYPAVAALMTLASDVKSILGPGTKVSYAADWTEYGAHVRSGGSEVRFPLDPLWASSSIDFVGVDAYWPLSDWRDGHDHADASIAPAIYDLHYLRSRMASGEAFDWYYADDAARVAQSRSVITDGVASKPWVFRQKDIRNWWSNRHFERMAGAELAAPTAWLAGAKPIRFMETGYPAVDRGANAPNVFPDVKSSESRLPVFSRGFRDDLMQARFLEAFISYFDPDADGYVEGSNPLSPVYGGRMVDPRYIHIWAWDARPYPAFPQQGSVWADSESWFTGHWLNGRLESPSIDRLVQSLVNETPDVSDLCSRPPIHAIADGYVLEQPISPRNSIEPLASFFGFEGQVSSGRINFVTRAHGAALALDREGFVARKNADLVEITRAQESELSRQFTVNFSDGESDYRTATVSSRRLEGLSNRDTSMDIAIVCTRAEAQRRADIMLQDAWAGRETITFELPPSALALEVGDHVSINIGGEARLFAITRITDAASREIEARSFEPELYEHVPPQLPAVSFSPPAIAGPPHVEILDLPLARSSPAVLQYLAVFADPWPGRLAVWRALGAGAFEFQQYVDQPAILGVTENIFGPGVTGRFDRANHLDVKLSGGALSSVDQVSAFAGRNAMAIRGPDGCWEMFSFLNAQLLSAGRWRLCKFIRGHGGSESRAAMTIPAGASVVLLDSAIAPLTSSLSDLGQALTYRIGPADRDYADDAYVEFTATPGASSLKPYSPVRPRGRRTAAGIEISFIRRGRVESDAWEPVNIPLGEESEAYQIDIRSGNNVVRTLSGNATSLVYPQAQELTDFGAAQTQLDVEIYQISAAAGRGFSLRTNISIL